MNYTKNFTREEMVRSETAKRLKINNTPPSVVDKRLRTLCEHILQPLRNRFGKPITISSGYRCERLNKVTAGSAMNSDHLYGNAADISGGGKAGNRELFELAVNMMESGEIQMVKQIIDEYDYSWIHISYQDGRTAKRNQVLHLTR